MCHWKDEEKLISKTFILLAKATTKCEKEIINVSKKLPSFRTILRIYFYHCDIDECSYGGHVTYLYFNLSDFVKYSRSICCSDK